MLRRLGRVGSGLQVAPPMLAVCDAMRPFELRRSDTEAEIALLKEAAIKAGAFDAVASSHFADGGASGGGGIEEGLHRSSVLSFDVPVLPFVASVLTFAFLARHDRRGCQGLGRGGRQGGRAAERLFLSLRRQPLH